jgi:hypothetical protein
MPVIVTTSRGREAHLATLLTSASEYLPHWRVRVVADGYDAEMALKYGARVIAPPCAEFRKLAWLLAGTRGLHPFERVAHLDADTLITAETRAALQSAPIFTGFGIAGLVDGRDVPDEQGVLVTSALRLTEALELAPLDDWRGYGPEDIHLRCRLAMLGLTPERVSIAWGRRPHSDALRMQAFGTETLRSSFARLTTLHNRQLEELRAQGYDLPPAVRASLEYRHK